MKGGNVLEEIEMLHGRKDSVVCIRLPTKFKAICEKKAKKLNVDLPVWVRKVLYEEIVSGRRKETG